MHSIAQIGEAPLSTIEEALGDPKVAKSLHTACKSHGTKGSKRSAPGDSTSPDSKKPKLETHKRDLDYSAMSPDELENSLRLPLTEDEEILRGTTVVVNRAPLMLAFVIELLRCTMPEQPPSSRLSLAQGVVSANSRTKAVSIGLEQAGGEEIISEGQPKVNIMGRQIPVLKRGGYTWSESSQESSSSSSKTLSQGSQSSKVWTASQKLVSKGSVFVAHAASISSPAARAKLITSLMVEKPHLETATHNAWAIRTSFGNSPLKQEASFDDGESGCGSFMLQQLRDLDISNTLVVLTRWYGGVMLGPDRWRIMRECVDGALSSQRRTSSLSGEALWALDTENRKPASSTIGMAIHRPEAARNYVLRSFHPVTQDAKKTVTAMNEEKAENLGKVLGALRKVFESWKDVVSPEELGRRAWTWYVRVRPEVADGPAGWGAKGQLDLGKILDLARKVEGKVEEKAVRDEQ